MPKATGGGGGGGATAQPRGATAALASVVAAAEAQPTSLIGRALDVPNAFWQGHDDGGYTVGTIVKAGRQDGGVYYKVTFAKQGGWSTPPANLKLDEVVGREIRLLHGHLTCPETLTALALAMSSKRSLATPPALSRS